MSNTRRTRADHARFDPRSADDAAPFFPSRDAAARERVGNGVRLERNGGGYF